MANLTHIAQSLKSRIRIPVVWQNRLAVFLVFASIFSGMATYAALRAVPPLGNDPTTVIWLLNLDFILLVGLIALVARRIVALWSGRKRGLAGSHLHVRLVYIFSILAAAPAIIMTVFSAFFFHFGIQSWFSDRVYTAIHESQAVAEAYLEEHIQVIRADTLAMANDINREAGFLVLNQTSFERAVKTQSLFRNLSEAIVFNSQGQIIAQSGPDVALGVKDVSVEYLKAADLGEVVITTSGNDDRVRSLVKLNNIEDAYLFVGREVDPKVLSHVAETRKASREYADLKLHSGKLQIMVTLLFVVVGLLLMMGAIWFGLILARQIVNPIAMLIMVADRVRAGDLAARVPEGEKLEEFKYLGKSFNKMTRQIEEQQTDLLEANRQLDQRRRFTESVLEGVTSGVISLDASGQIALVNGAACRLLGYKEQNLIGRMINDVLPGFFQLVTEDRGNVSEGELHYEVTHVSGQKADHRVFLVRADIDKRGSGVVTFDDITALQSAQRKAAWADVARRIAHEIKNPLTPIQLSAERLHRKYLEQISEGRESFAECTETIIKNVGDIGRMVSEFSDFARMPEPVMEQANLAAHVQETLSLHKNAHTDVKFTLDIVPQAKDFDVLFDPAQVRQVLNNLVQNAVDSVQMRIARGNIKKGKVEVLVDQDGDNIRILVKDNGIGLPEGEVPARLTEPYITHKPRGTGLGLAIVKKIMDDHNGGVLINPVLDKPLKTGAVMGVVFPIAAQDRDINKTINNKAA